MNDLTPHNTLGRKLQSSPLTGSPEQGQPVVNLAASCDPPVASPAL
jgi:hypothetical protein